VILELSLCGDDKSKIIEGKLTQLRDSNGEPG